MSWLDSIGSWDGGLIQKYNDTVNDWNRVFDTDQNVVLQTLEFTAGLGNRVLGTTYEEPWKAINAVGQGAYVTAGVAGRAVTAPVALAHPEWGKQLGLTPDAYRQKVWGSVFDLDAATSPGQIAQAGGILPSMLFGGLIGGVVNARSGLPDNVNPYDPAQQSKYFTGDGAIAKGSSGYADLTLSMALDPTNLAGPAFKVTKALSLGEKALSRAPEGLLARAGVTSTTPEKFIKGFESGKWSEFRDYHRENYGKGTLSFLEHDFVKNHIDRGEQQAVASLLNNTPPDSLNDLMRVASGYGTPAEIDEAALRLNQSWSAKPGESAYLLDRIKSGMAERSWSANAGSQILDDPALLDKQGKLLADFLDDTATPVGVARQNALARMAEDAKTAPWMTSTPKSGPAAKLADRAARSRVNTVQGVKQTVSKDVFTDFAEPEITMYQPTPQHPVMLVMNRAANRVRKGVDFFTVRRPEGVVYTHDGDSWREIVAQARLADKFLDGRLSMVEEGQEHLGTETQMWIDRFVNADSMAGRGATAEAFGQRVFHLQAAKYGLTGEAATEIFNELKRQQAVFKSQLKQNKGMFVSYYDGANPVISHDPLLARENVDNLVWFMDPREVDKALRRHSPEEWNNMFAASYPGADAVSAIADFAAGKGPHPMADGGVMFLDAVNNAFKSWALIRLGYTVRNLGEATLSMTASGHILDLAMTALRSTPEATKNWMLNRAAGTQKLYDTVLTKGHARPDLYSLRYMEQYHEAYVNHLTDLENLLLERPGNLKITPDMPADLIDQIGELRAAQDLSFHYHATNGGLPELTGDWLATTDSKVKADMAAYDMHEYLSPYEDSLGGTKVDYSIAPDGSPETVLVGVTAWIGDHAAQYGAGERAVRYPSEWIDLADGFIKPEYYDEVFKPEVVERYWNYDLAPDGPPHLRPDPTKSGVEALAEAVAERAEDPSKLLEYQLATGEWAPLSKATVKRWIRERTKDGEFKPAPDDMNLHVRVRDRGKKPEVVKVAAYGKTVDFTDLRTVPAGLDVSDRAALAEWARANGVGKVKVKDPEWGTTTLVLRDTADYKGGQGFKPIARRNVERIYEDAKTGVTTVAPKAARSAENRAKRAALKRAMRSSKTPVRAKLTGVRIPEEAVKGYSARTIREMMDRDLIGAVRELAEEKAQAIVDRDYAVKIRQEREAQRAGYAGKRVVGANSWFSGDLGQVMFGRTSAQNTNDKFVSAGNKVADIVGATVDVKVRPGEGRYYESWANTVNQKFRGSSEVDPVAQRLLTVGRAGTEDWLMLSRDGRQFAADMGWNTPSKIDDHLFRLQSSLDLYVPNGPIRDAYLAGEPITEDMVRYFSQASGHAPELKGELVPMSAEYADKVEYQGRLDERVASRLLKMLGTLPEDTFARHPLFRTVAEKQYGKLTREAVARKAPGEGLTVDEINRLRKRASEHARQEVNRTLFTVNRRTDAATKMRFLSPFYAAWENQIMRWSGFAIHHPDHMAQFASKVALAANNMFIVNENGDPIDLAEAMKPENITKSTWVTPFPNASGLGGNVKVSVQSLDIISGGQPGPGLGPLAAIPLAYATQNRPDIQDQMTWAFPVGVPDNPLQMLLPNAVRKMMASDEDSRAWGNSMNLIAATEYLRWQKGERKDQPTLKEITDKANTLTKLKFATALTAPFSIQYGSEIDFYKQALRDLQDFYRDQPNGQQLADNAFLQKYPEAFVVLPSFSENNAKGMATTDAVKNMQRYRNLGQIADAKGDYGLFGFVANYGLKYNKDDFSGAAYSWQFRSDAGAGTDNYRQVRNPEQLYSQALVDKGWVQFSTMMDAIDGELRARGIDPTSKLGLQVLQGARRAYAQDNRYVTQPDGTRIQNPWFLDYNSSDKAKYERRAEFFNSVLQDDRFMADHGKDPLIKSIGAYLSLRARTGTALLQAKQMGGSSSLQAKTNLAISQYFAQGVDQLRRGNLEFSSWLDRYFTNDSVVLG